MPASGGIQRNGSVLPRPRETYGERPGLWIRLRAWLQRLSLDRQLAAGKPAWASAELRLRAAQLTSPGARRALADEIDRLLEVVARPPRPRGAAAPLDRSAVLACDELLRALAHDLRDAKPVQVHGVALVRQLLRDGASPLYAAGTGGSLDSAIRRARAALLFD